MPETHGRRRAALRSLLRERELDALLVVDLRNVRYLTGFTGSNAALLVAAGDEPGAEKRTRFCTDGRYLTQSAQQLPDLERLVDRPCPPALLREAAGQDLGRTGFESHRVTVDELDTFTEVAAGIELVRAPGLVEQLRMVKDDAEIEALRMACAAADRALADLIEHGGLAAGRTEREVARDLESRMLDHGAAGPSFETIVAAGAHSAVPHHRPTDAVLHAGDLVKLDFGALVDGYHSDMTRTFVLGAPADWQRELYDRAGRGTEFLHGLGHGVGLEIHEAPALAKTGEGRLAAGMAVTVEPGVYLSGRGGVRIEDTLVVRDGDPELLTLTTKQLVVV
jgi:Xaa-Pro aminopeptidase